MSDVWRAFTGYHNNSSAHTKLNCDSSHSSTKTFIDKYLTITIRNVPLCNRPTLPNLRVQLECQKYLENIYWIPQYLKCSYRAQLWIFTFLYLDFYW
ncbi:hypothetical protein J6590_025120 [Homalodisca vitripennis]|nr:hypothetical protein J6590_025120 [Homalodisca vitripennis]